LKIQLLTTLLLLSTICLSQEKTDLFVNVGFSLQPAFSTQHVRNLEDFSALSNINLTVGNSKAAAFLSVGSVTKLGFGSIQKYTYTIGSYTVNSTTTDFIEHGPEIETGFNCHFGKNKRFRFWCGTSIAFNFINADNLKLVLRPVILGLSFNLLK